MVQAAFYVAFQLCRNLTAQLVNRIVERQRPLNILGDQPCYKNKACLIGTQYICVTQYVSVHDWSRIVESVLLV